MLFRKYHLVIFRENKGSCCKFQVKAWMIVLGIALLLAMLAGNVVFWSYATGYRLMTQELAEAKKTLNDQTTQLLSLVGKTRNLEKDLSRVHDFDAKLRIMMNIDQESFDPSSNGLGGPESREFFKNYLPIHRQELLVRKMHNFLDSLSTDIRLEEVRQQELLSGLSKNTNNLASTPSIWPAKGFVTSKFGYRSSPFTGYRDFHKGLDISAKTGTPVKATATGTVIFAGWDGAYGRCVVVNHGSGLVTRYAHLDRITVETAQYVKRGEQIGHLGSSGRSTGPHVHYEVRLNGVCVDPMRYILTL